MGQTLSQSFPKVAQMVPRPHFLEGVQSGAKGTDSESAATGWSAVLSCSGGNFSESFKDQSMLGSWVTAQNKPTRNLMGSLMSQDSRDCHVPNPRTNLPVVSPFNHGSWLKKTQREEPVSPTRTPNLIGAGMGNQPFPDPEGLSFLGPDSHLMSAVHTNAHTSALSS